MTMGSGRRIWRCSATAAERSRATSVACRIRAAQAATPRPLARAVKPMRKATSQKGPVEAIREATTTSMTHTATAVVWRTVQKTDASAGSTTRSGTSGRSSPVRASSRTTATVSRNSQSASAQFPIRAAPASVSPGSEPGSGGLRAADGRRNPMTTACLPPVRPYRPTCSKLPAPGPRVSASAGGSESAGTVTERNEVLRRRVKPMDS